MVSLPLGFTSPKSRSAIALPASAPRAQVLSIAGMFSLSHSRVRGLPVVSTSTMGFPVALSALSSCLWGSGMLMSDLDVPSPFMLLISPRAATTTSDCLARATASFIMDCSGRLWTGSGL